MTDRSEMIAAYLDGSLEGVALETFEAELEQNAALAEDLARYSANDDLLRAAFDAPMQEPVDAALLERMGLGAPRVSEPTPVSNAILAANDNPPFWKRWRLPIGGAVAASLALIAVFQAVQTPRGETEFALALDTTPSATSVRLADGGSFTPRLTFTANDGRYCREYLLTGAAGSETGIACRSGGTWNVEARTKGGRMLADSGKIVTASGDSQANLDAVYTRLGASDPLNAEAERELIKKKWSNP